MYIQEKLEEIEFAIHTVENKCYIWQLINKKKLLCSYKSLDTVHVTN